MGKKCKCLIINRIDKHLGYFEFRSFALCQRYYGYSIHIRPCTILLRENKHSNQTGQHIVISNKTNNCSLLNFDNR